MVESVSYGSGASSPEETAVYCAKMRAEIEADPAFIALKARVGAQNEELRAIMGVEPANRFINKIEAAIDASFAESFCGNTNETNGLAGLIRKAKPNG